MKSSGQLFVLSGPSGVGKSSLRENVRREFPRLAYSISYTTRPPRHGEIEGKDYHFISEETFLAMRKAGAFVEWATVHGNYYGTSGDLLEKSLNENRDVLLEIDVQGARQVKARFPQACCIFVLPPDRETLEQRLLKRGTEQGEDIETRLENALGELSEASWYDYLIINDALDEAVEALKAIVLAAPYRRQVVLPQVRDLLQGE
ncbi:MAG: guanylate kinase [Deltaproteobacteria bacterium]|jgi:guanylate kinase